MIRGRPWNGCTWSEPTVIESVAARPIIWNSGDAINKLYPILLFVVVHSAFAA